MVTAELALGLPTVVAVTAIAVGAVGVAGAQLRCVDAASVAARLAARGESAAVVAAAVAATGPPGATAKISHELGLVAVDVAASVRLPVGGHLVPAFVVHERVVAQDEAVPP